MSPSQKLLVFGLIQQATEGDYVDGMFETTDQDADVLEGLKIQAWKEQGGKSALDAFRDLVTLMNEISPGWNSIFAKAMRGRGSTREDPRGKLQVWYLKLNLSTADGESTRPGSAGQSGSGDIMREKSALRREQIFAIREYGREGQREEKDTGGSRSRWRRRD